MSENTSWNARTFTDKAIKKAVQEEVYKLALVVLGNNELKVEESKEGFDRYPYCKHETKSYCPVGNRKAHFLGRFKEYVVFGNTRLEVYLEVLRLLANDSSVYYPIVSYRKENEWIEREKVEALKEEYR